MTPQSNRPVWLGHQWTGRAKPQRRALCVVWALGALSALALASAAARANDFPTLDRVVYVQECMRAHPGPGFEMTSKCVCVLDSLAAQLSYDEFVTMNTISKATTIAGERGGTIRDAPSMAGQLKRYRALQAQAEKGCFLSTAPR